MPIKSIQLTGYKTFASKTLFEFADTITAIVGPNGSGKSNIADSLRWVLGEQSYSLLRGKRTVDMIFSGSQYRAPSGLASASVLFDNASGWLPIDYSEVSITRRAFRDGTNEYLINGQKMRLRDVNELLAKSGLAERTYTIIGQGLVDRALALKPEERRKLFEEAAGIGLYRGRREEALRRLDTTRRNLDRVADILAELKPRLRSLERQSRRAREYEQVKTDLEVLLREWYGYHWHRAQRELREAREIARKQESALETTRTGQATLSDEINGLRDQMTALRAQLGTWHRELGQLHNQRESINRELAVAAERRRALETRRDSTQTEIARLQEELRAHEERKTHAAADAKTRQDEAAEAAAQLEAARTQLNERLGARKKIETVLGKIRDALAEQESRRVRQQTERATLEAQVQQQADSLTELEEKLTEAETLWKSAEEKRTEANAQRREAEQRVQQAQSALRAQRERVSTADAARGRLQSEIEERQHSHIGIKTQLDVLAQAEKALTGYAEGAKALLQAARAGKLTGTQGTLSQAITIPSGLETAIAAALGEYLDAVLLDARNAADASLDVLAQAQARGTLLPIPNSVPHAPSGGHTPNNTRGRAADLVQTTPELRPVIDLLLGNIWVVEDRAGARQALRGQPPGIQAVTLAGEVFHAAGPIIAGNTGSTSPALVRARQTRELTESLQTLVREINDLETQISDAQRELLELRAEQVDLDDALRTARQSAGETARAAQSAQNAVDQVQRQRDWHRQQQTTLVTRQKASKDALARLVAAETEWTETADKLNQALRAQSQQLAALPLDEMQAQVSHWTTRHAVAKNAATEAQNRLHERTQIVVQAKQNFARQQHTLETLAQSIELQTTNSADLHQRETDLAGQEDAFQALIGPAETQLAELELQQEKIQVEEARARQELTVSERHHAQAQIALARRQESLDTLRDRVEDDFGLVEFTYEAEVEGPTPLPFGQQLVEKLPFVDEISPDLEGKIKQMRAQLRRMGAINPEAQKEYEEVQERHGFMVEQIADLEQAEADIKAVIAELDELMEREFRQTFDAVASEFRETFSRLFGGGSARLVLSDPDDLTNSGVDIEARLPGRRTQGLSLLSGGERSLTAVALVFSLLKVSPTPFCVLDEVDAMLDEANVGRFSELLHELSENTQFIVITHNRNTVQVADTIYGITMGRDSTSQILSLKLDEVAEALKQ